MGRGRVGRSLGAGTVGNALLRKLAERTGLRAECCAAMDGLRRRGGGHDPGQVLVDVAVMLADGGEAIADIPAPADQPALHGPVASPATAWRVLVGINEQRSADLHRSGRSPGNGPVRKGMIIAKFRQM
ncbi:MAG TPA: hypothetical protein VFP72_18920 [Kineosporiaceae bacterium]|nr:hypothetical protein [Kineosporiaceae bacterium]